MLTRKRERNLLVGGYSPALIVCGLLVFVLVSVASGNAPSEGHGAAEDSGGHGDAGTEEGGEHGEEGGGGEHGGHEVKRFQVAKFDFAYVKPNFIVAIWILYACGAKIFFHWEKYLSRFFPESCLLIIIGVILGLFLYFANEKGYELNTTLFFLVILPPIILDAGYFMPARSFFDQLGTILLYAILGTLLNTLFLGFALWGVYEGGGFKNLESPLLLLDSLVFASLLAAVDPVAVLAVFESVHVNEILYIIVFGESLLNDGISVVLYHLFEGLSEIGADNILPVDVVAGVGSFFVIVFGATGIGMVLGLFAGFMSRFTKHVRIMEPLIVFVIGYLSFIVAEMFHLSGIISTTFCGITMRKYVEANFSQKSQTTIRFVLKLGASVSETIIFMYIGVSAVSDTHHWDTAFVILTLIFCLIIRAIGVIILTYFANLIRVVKLTKIDQFIMAYGGLRGAIAFALAVLLDSGHFKHRRLFITSTVVVVYFTNIAMGSTIKALVTFLKVKRAEHRVLSMGEKIVYRFIDHTMGGIEDITDQKGHHLLRERFSHFNNNYLKPFIVGKKNPQRGGWQILSVYNRINAKAAKKFLKRSDSATTPPSHLYRNVSYLDLSRTPSVSQLFAPTASNMNHVGFGNWWDSNVSLPRGMESPADGLYPVIDRQVFESQSGRKMKDASRTHHISEDVVTNNRNSRERMGHVASTPTPPLHSPSGALSIGAAYAVRPSFPMATDEQSSTNGMNGKKVSFADHNRLTGSEVIQRLPIIPDTEFVNSESDDDELEGGVAMFPEMRSERRQPTELELSLPWKRIVDEESDFPILSPSRMRLAGEFIDSAAAADREGGGERGERGERGDVAIVEFEIRTPDSDRTGEDLHGISNLGYADDERNRMEIVMMSPSSSSTASDVGRGGEGNTNNNNRMSETHGISRRMMDRAKEKRQKSDDAELAATGASFEMREITLDPSSLAGATSRYAEEDLEAGGGERGGGGGGAGGGGVGAERRVPWSK